MADPTPTFEVTFGNSNVINNDVLRTEISGGEAWASPRLRTDTRNDEVKTDWTSGGRAKLDMSCRVPPNGSYVEYEASDKYGTYGGAALRVSEQIGQGNFKRDNYLAVEILFDITHVSSDFNQKATEENITVWDYYNLKILNVASTQRGIEAWRGIYVAIHPYLLNTGEIYVAEQRRTRISIVPGVRAWKKEDLPITGNYGKGHLYEEEESVKNREQIHLPCLIGAGTYTITVRVIRLLSNLMRSLGGDLQVVMHNRGEHHQSDWANGGKKLTYTIDPILENDNTKLDTALIAERPYNDDTSNPLYYNGQYQADSYVTFALNALSPDPDWGHGTALYAVIYLMLTGTLNDTEIVNPANCFNWYELRKPTSGQSAVYDNPRILVPSAYAEHVKVENDGVASTFKIKKGYPFLIGSEIDYPTDPTEITVHMPENPGLAVQFVTLMYRLVADGDNYKVDPSCPSAIEMHTGICTLGGLKRDCTLIEPIVPIKVEANPQIVTFSIKKWKASNPLYLQIQRQIISTTPIEDEGLKVEFSLIDPVTEEIIQTAAERFPLGIDNVQTYDVTFELAPEYHKVGAEYNVLVKVYDVDGGEKSFTYKVTTNTPKVKNENVINQLFLEPLSGQKNVILKVSGLKMNTVPESTAFWYTLTGYKNSISESNYEFTATFADDATTPNQMPKWEIPVTLQENTTYIIVFEVWTHADPDVLTEYPDASYILTYTVDMGVLKNVTIKETYDGDDKITEQEKVKTTWSFTAETTLPIQSEHVHKWTAELTDLTVPEPVPYTWAFEETGSTLNVDDTAVKLMSIGRYRMTLKVADAADASVALAITREGTIGGLKVGGTLKNGVHSIKLREPFVYPHPTNAEYRLLKDGFVGAVESPWEIRNETVVGSMSAGSPVWMVHPRDLSFRVLATASDANITNALKELIALLTVNPRQPTELNLWTSDGKQNLFISGYPEVGTPVIEMRESTAAIVAITLKCPRYAWRGNEVKETPNKKEYTISPIGNLPPAFEIIVRPASNKLSKIVLRRADDNQVEPIYLKIDSISNVRSVRIHYDPIMQDLAILVRHNVGDKGGTSGHAVPTPMSRCKLAKSPVWLVKNDDNVPFRETNAFYILDAQSDLRQLNLTPGVNNIIETDGIIEEVTITPYYAHWW